MHKKRVEIMSIHYAPYHIDAFHVKFHFERKPTQSHTPGWQKAINEWDSQCSNAQVVLLKGRAAAQSITIRRLLTLSTYLVANTWSAQ